MMSRSAFAACSSLFFAVSLLALPVLADGTGDPGAPVYKAKCASCHGADGSGATPVGKSLAIRDLRAPAVQKLSDADLTKVISDGKGKMPAYAKKLSAVQIQALVATIRSMASK
jgi:mono/diheme cytochrome c family protein